MPASPCLELQEFSLQTSVILNPSFLALVFLCFCFFSFPVNYLSRYSLDPSYWLYINELGSGLSCFKVSPRKSHSFCDYQVFTDLIQLLLGGPILCSKT